VAAFANQISDDPMLLSLLQIFDAKGSGLGSSQPAAKQDCQRGIIAFAAKAVAPSSCQ
jgi:hypothetical protein